MMYLIASSNEAYANRITAWLDYATDRNDGTFQIALACVDPGAWSAALAATYPDVRIVPVSRADLPFAPPLDHLQAGGFLDALNPADDDLMLFTDGDAYMQRPPDADERAALQAWPDGVIGLAYNAGPDDTLATEAARLYPQHTPLIVPDIDFTWPIYNLGVIICRAATYRRWFAHYCRVRPSFDGLFDHHAAQQWGLCAVLPQIPLDVRVVPATWHVHGHYPPPFGERIDRARGQITVNGTVAWFRHHL